MTPGFPAFRDDYLDAEDCSRHLYREAIFFVLTSHLIILSSSLISHLHILLVLAPPALTSPCPPSNPIRHIALLTRLVLHPPLVDAEMVLALKSGEETLRKGSKSFDVAKLLWGREMRVGLIAVYGWCRVTVSQ